MTTNIVILQQKSGTSTDWESVDPVLLEGEIGYESDTKKIKIGDGVSTWTVLDYQVQDLATVATTGDYTDLINQPTIPTATSDLTNDSDYVVSSDLATVATSGDYADLSNAPNLATVATSGDYDDLNNQPTIPTATSDLTNDSDYVVSTDLATVATSGDYGDLANQPTIPTATSDLTNDSDYVVSTDLATVATSGEYTDLINTPTLATVATSGDYTDLTNQPTIPTTTSELTNDSGYIVTGDSIDATTLDFTNVPKSDPFVEGVLWSNGGILTISAG